MTLYSDIRRYAMALVVCALAVGLGACREQAPARAVITGVEPSRGPGNAAIRLRILGENLGPRVVTVFTEQAESRIDSDYQVSLSGIPLTDVTFGDDGTLLATVPAGLEPQSYDLQVTEPGGHESVLPKAYRVLEAIEFDDLVTGFRFSPVGAQRVGQPFTVTIEAIDSAGEVVPTFNGSGSLEDRTGTVAPTSIGRFAFGSWSGLLEVSQPHANNALTLTAMGGQTGGSNEFPVTARTPRALRFTTPEPTVAAGACSPGLTLEAVDEFGPVANLTGDLLPIALAADRLDLALFRDAGCTTPWTGAGIAPGNASATFHFRATRAGSGAIAALAEGLSPDEQRVFVTAGGPARLVFLSAPQVVNAGLCSQPVRVQVQDAFGNRAAFQSLALALSASPDAGFAFHAEATCATTASSAPVDPASGLATFYFRGTVANVIDVTATAGGLTPASQSQQIIPEGAPAKLAITSLPQSLSAGQCSAALIVQAQDSLGNAVNVESPLVVRLDATSPTGFGFFAEASCSMPLTDAVIDTGDVSARVYFRGTAAGVVSVLASAPGLTAASQNETVLPAPADRLLFRSPPQTVVATSCSQAVTVEAQDPFGNPSPAAMATAFTLTASPSTGFRFFSDATCASELTAPQLEAGTSSSTFWFESTAAGSVTISASRTGWQQATQAADILAGAPSQLVFTSAVQTVIAGTCSGVLAVELRDVAGNPAGGTSEHRVDLSSSPSTVLTFFSDAACATPIGFATISASSSDTTWFFRGTLAGAATVSASVSGLPDANQAATISPASADRLAFTTSSQTLGAGVCSGAVTVQTRDRFGNVAPVAATRAISLTASPAGAASFFSDSGCGSPTTEREIAVSGTGTTFWFRAQLAGGLDVIASTPGWTDESQPQQISAGSATRLAFLTPPQTVSVGGCSGAVELELQDDFGNAAPRASATSVTLAASPPGGVSFFSDDACAIGTGTASIPASATRGTFHFGGTVPGQVTVTASAAPLTSATLELTIAEADAPSRIVFLTPARIVDAGDCSPALSLQTQDSFGNPRVVNAATTVTVTTGGASGVTIFADASCATPVTSVVIAEGTQDRDFHFRGTLTGTHAINVAAFGLSPASQAQQLRPAIAERFVFTTGARTMPAGSCSDVLTIQTRDRFGNVSAVAANTTASLSATPSAGFTFHSDASCTAAVSERTLLAGATASSFYVRGTGTGSVSVTVSAAAFDPVSQTQTVLASPPDRLVFSSAPPIVPAGECSPALSIQARDAFGNASVVSTGTTVTFSASPSGGFAFYADAACATPITTRSIAANTHTATVHVRGTVARTVDVQASSPGFTPGAQVHTIRPAAADRLVFTSTAQTLVAGACSGAATLETRDAFGNVAPLASSTEITLLAAPDVGVTFFSDPGCTSAVTSATIAADASATTFHFVGTRSGTSSLNASSNGLLAASQGLTIQAAPPDRLVFTTTAQSVTAGACSGLATVELRDAFGNVASLSSSTTVTLQASPPGGFTFHSDASCSTAVSSRVIAASTSTASFYFRGTQTGPVSVSAIASGLTPAEQSQTIRAAPADRLVFTTAPQTIVAGTCSAAVTVETRDPFGNVSAVDASTDVDFNAAPNSGFTFFADAGCATPITRGSIAAGGSSVSVHFRGTVAGPVNVTASATGLAPTIQAQGIEAAAADRLVFTSIAQNVVAGACSGAVTLQTRDEFGNASAMPMSTSVELLATPSADFTFYADDACSSAITTGTLGASSSATSFYFRATAAGSVRIDVAAAGLAGASQVRTIQSAPADRLIFTTGPHSLVAGVCSPVATLETRDQFGNVAPLGAPRTVDLAAEPSAGFTFYSDAACATPVSTRPIAASSSTTSFYFRGTAAGSVAITASSPGLTQASQSQVIQPAPADRVAFTSSGQSVVAGLCSGVANLETQDPFGNASPLLAPRTIDLAASPSSGFTFYSDASCATPVSTRTIATSSSATSFYFRGTLAASVAVTASSAGFTSANQAQTVTPAPADRLVFTTGAQTLVAGACSAVVTLQTRDEFGNASAMTAPKTVDLTAAPSSDFAFFSDAGCSTPVTTRTIATSSSTTSFYVRGTAATPVTVTASSLGLTQASQSHTVQAAPADRLVFTTSPQALIAGVCSDLASVETRDAFGNVSPLTAPRSVDLTASPTTGFTFYSDAACATPVSTRTIAASSSTTSFYFRGTLATAVNVTASSAGFLSAAQSQTLTPAPADRLVFTTVAQNVVAGACSNEVSIETRDAFGNASAVTTPTSVDLTASPSSNFTFFSDVACSAPVTARTIAASSSTTRFYFRGTAATSVSVTASSAGLTQAAQSHSIQAAPADRMVFTTSPQTIVAGVCSAIATLQTRDEFGNVSALTAPKTVDLTASPSAGFTFYSDAACATPVSTRIIASSSSATTFYFRGTAAGSVGVTASSPGLAQASQTQVIQPAPADRVVFASTTQSVIAGLCSSVATLETRDPFGNASPLLAPRTIDLSASPSSGFTFYSDASCATPVTTRTIAASSSTTGFYFRGTLAGLVTVTASSAGFTSANQSQTVAPAPADRLVFTTGAQTLFAGICSAIATLQSRDEFGNASPMTSPKTVDLTAAPSSNFTFFSDAACSTPVTTRTIAASSSTTSFYFRGTSATSVSITASGTGLTPTAQSQTIQAAPADRLVFTTGPQTLIAGECSAVATLQTRDAFGNTSPLTAPKSVDLTAGGGVTFFSDPGCASTITSRTIDASSSTTSFYFRGTSAGPATLTAAAIGLTEATQGHTVQPAPADRLAFITPPLSVVAGTCSSAATLQTRDAFGNASPLTFEDTVLVEGPPSVSFAVYSDPACSTPTGALTVPPGASVASFYVRGTVAGAFTVSASSSTLLATTQDQTIVAAPADRLVITTAPQTVTAGLCSSVLTLQTRDAFGNVAPLVTPRTINLAASPSTGFGFYSDAACATPVSSRTIAASSSTTGVYFRGTLAGSVGVTASSAGLLPASQTQTVPPAPPDRLVFLTNPQSIVAGTCSAIATLQTRDAFGNVSALPEAKSVSLTAMPNTGFTFHSDASCATAAITTRNMAIGATQTSYYFRGTSAGSITTSGAAAGLLSGGQMQVVTPSATTQFTWDTIASPQSWGVAFSATLRARDVYGNPTPAYLGTASLTATPLSDFTCTTGCSSGATTNAFSAGVWTGTLTFETVGTGRALVATAGALTGTSATFTVTGPGRSAPSVILRANPVVILVGQTVTFDVAQSRDYTTPSANLEVSWDGTGATAGAPPWTAWTTLKGALITYNTAGSYQARVAVRDADGDIGYATQLITVLPAGSTICRVTTSLDVDDGATGCNSGFGTDGQLSLREAFRLANSLTGKQVVTFSGAMTIILASTLSSTGPMDLLAPSGVVIQGRSLSFSGSATLIAGVEFASQTAAITLGGTSTVQDSVFRAMPGVSVTGTGTFRRVQMIGCTGSCIRNDTTNLLTVIGSEFRGGSSVSGIAINACPDGGLGTPPDVLELRTTVFSGLGTGVRFNQGCDGTIRNNTFAANATGILFSGNGCGLLGCNSHSLRNNVFTGHTTSAVTCSGSNSFASRDYHVLFGNAANGCVSPANANTSTANPLYVNAAFSDFRLQSTSPAVETGVDTGIDVNGVAPGNYFGTRPDRGGRESF